MRRMKAQKEVLCIQVGSDLRFATRPGCTELGVLRCGFGTPNKLQEGKSRRWIDGYRDIL